MTEAANEQEHKVAHDWLKGNITCYADLNLKEGQDAQNKVKLTLLVVFS